MTNKTLKTDLFKRIALILGIVYFAIATYGGSYYVGPMMICALSFWLYHELKNRNQPF
jgi:hypothetical protein